MFRFLLGVAFGAAGYWAWQSFGRDLLGLGNDQDMSYSSYSSNASFTSGGSSYGTSSTSAPTTSGTSSSPSSGSTESPSSGT